MKKQAWATRWFLPCACAATILAAGGCGDGAAELEQGLALLRDGQPAGALPLLEKATRRMPGSATAHCNLGVAYAAQGDTARATASFRRAAELLPEDPRALELLGEMFAAQQRWDDARNVLAEAQDRDRASARILTARGAVEFSDGQPARAQDLFNRALRIEPGYPPALYNMSQVFQQYPDGDKTAIAYLEKYLGSGAVDREHSAKAREQLLALRRKAAGPVVTGPSPAIALVEAARKAVKEQDFTRALIRLKEAVRTDPAHPDGHWELARLYDEYLDDRETAAGLYESFATRFPADGRSSTARERQAALARPKRTPLASVAGSEGPDAARADAAYRQGVARHREQDWRAAAENYITALRYDARRVLAAVNLGLVLKADRDLEGARDALEYAHRLQPEQPDAGYYLAEVYRELGQRPEAELIAKSVAAANPGHVRVYYLLGMLARDAQNLEEARVHFKTYVDRAPANDPLVARVREWLATQQP